MEKKSEVCTVKLEGIEVQVNLQFIKSWEGIRLSAHMQSPEKSVEDKLLDVVAYYERAVANMDEVSEKLGDRPADEVLKFVGKAIKEATPKN